MRRFYWYNLGITAKLWLAFVVLFVFFAMASIAGFVGLAVVGGAEADIVANMDIRGKVLEMEGQLEKARRLYRDFILNTPDMGFVQAQERFCQPALAVAARVIALSEELKSAIAALPPGAAIARRNVDMNFFSSTARRFTQTLLSEHELATVVGDPENGLDARLAASLARLSELFASLPQAAMTLQEVIILVKQYHIGHQRPVMQAASNKLELLRRLAGGLPLARQAPKQPGLPPIPGTRCGWWGQRGARHGQKRHLTPCPALTTQSGYERLQYKPSRHFQVFRHPPAFYRHLPGCWRARTHRAYWPQRFG